MPINRMALMRDALALADAIALALGFLLSYWITSDLFARHFESFREYLWLLWIIESDWMLTLWLFGLDESSSLRLAAELAGKLVRAHVIAGLALLALMYSTHSIEISRLLVWVFIFLSFGFLLLEKLAAGCFVRAAQSAGAVRRPAAVLVGSPADAAAYLRQQQRIPAMTATVVGLLTAGPDRNDGSSR